MALIEGCKHSLEITVPVDTVKAETEKVVEKIRQKVRLPGFRPGKAPAELVRSRFAPDIRQEVIESLLPKYFRERVEAEQLEVVGTPDITDVHFHAGEPLRFKAEFEVAPSIELKEYRGLRVTYNEPVVTPEDIEERLASLRDTKAEFVNIDPRPVESGDYAVVSLESLGGVTPPIKQDETTLHIGDEGTLPAFSENLSGMTPGESKEFEVAYPEDYGQDKIAGKTVNFRATLKVIRKKELPELNDEFAQDMGDYQTLDELREAVRRAIFGEREFEAQQKAKESLVEQLVETHEFPVPEAYLDRQIEANIEQYARTLAAQGVDPRNLKLDWDKVKAAQKDRAVKDVKASLLLDRIAEREALYATNEEVDRELQRFARQQREPVAALRMKFEKDGTLRRIAGRIRTEKTLGLLFEQARKEAGTES